MRRIIFCIILLFTLTLSLKSQEVTVTSAFDSSRIFIGDQINYTITVEQPSDMEVTVPLFKDTLTKNIEILMGPFTDSSSVSEGRLRITGKYLITSFDSGYYQVNPVYAEVKTSEGLKRFYSGYSQLEVMKVRIAPADTAAKIYDIIKPYRAPLTLGEIMPWVLILLVATALVWAIIRYIKKHKKNKPEIEDTVNKEPAHIIAFRELEKLRDQSLWQKGEIKNYYTRLTEILRQYLEDRYHVYSLELTTSETLLALIQTGFNKDALFNQLKNILTAADLVKFAKFKPLPEDNEAYFKSSWEFVNATKEIESVLVNAEENNKSQEVSL